ncbi:hypothetical protein TREES_T100009107 [Tupaia chinensis]|uniref:Uncharacterized protein n=1 Tax=Tupaia chinensis TaxID=246437 RepID=L9KLN5_TUPCH|nr:hypothetical protein TREES_T100009107 [Tupaia chinensis]
MGTQRGSWSCAAASAIAIVHTEPLTAESLFFGRATAFNEHQAEWPRTCWNSQSAGAGSGSGRTLTSTAQRNTETGRGLRTHAGRPKAEFKRTNQYMLIRVTINHHEDRNRHTEGQLETPTNTHSSDDGAQAKSPVLLKQLRKSSVFEPVTDILESINQNIHKETLETDCLGHLQPHKTQGLLNESATGFLTHINTVTGAF